MSRFYMYDAQNDTFAPVAEFSAKGGFVRNMQAVAKKTGKKATRMGKAVGKQASLRGQQALGLATSAPGLAVLGAGTLGAGTYGAYKLNKKRKEDAKSPLQKRYESLRSRLGR